MDKTLRPFLRKVDHDRDALGRSLQTSVNILQTAIRVDGVDLESNR